MKVLILSHNPMSSKYSIGKTLLSFFSQFKKEELCQLYIHPDRPDRDACSSYYRITDKNVLKGVFTRSVAGGTVVPVSPTGQEQQNMNYHHKKTIGMKKKHRPSRELMRDVVWTISPWYNGSLKAWIDAQKPTCIFVAIGSGKFLYNMAIKISRDYGIPIYTYVCDDFYFINTPKGFLGNIWKITLDKKTKELMSSSKQIISICDEMSGLYSNEFSRPAATVMTGTNYEINEPNIKKYINTISYFGKINLNRYKSIADICRVIDEINRENGTSYEVEIFCEEPDETVLAEFKDIYSAKFCGFLNGHDFDKRFFASDALLHIEAFDEASIDRVKHSVSTKIADSLASGITLFAYGPPNVASIAHLLRNNCAIVATSRNELKEKLIQLFSDETYRESSVKNNIETAKRFHCPLTVSKTIYSLLSDT